ncbi:hypothetical protein C8Q70DRAFT_1031605 [Cubamyces menziesii]|nr:hypothetical protein C8Q70DRAFT_1031605 [Cubamyces menziesii]
MTFKNASAQTVKGASITSNAMQEAQKALDSAIRPAQPGGIAYRVEKGLVEAVDGFNKATDNSKGWDILLDGVNTLVESLPPLLRTLNALAQVHPFLQVAVGAFSVVVELEMKRHDNDRKISLLFLEMRNMMSTLVQLKDVRPNHVGLDGVSIGERLDNLINMAAEDIKECANACDTYARKRLFTKVAKAFSWDAALKEYIQRFSDRKAELNFAIAVHTGTRIDQANNKLDTLMGKMDIVLEFFQKAVPRDQRVLAEAIRQRGGTEVVLTRMDVLQELLLQEQQLEAGTRFVQPASPTAGPGVRTGNDTAGPLRLGSRTRSVEHLRGERSVPRRRTIYEIPAKGRNGDGEEHTYPSYHAPVSPYVVPSPNDAPDPLDGAHGSQVPGRVQAGGKDVKQSSELVELLQDLKEEPAVAMQRNLVLFERRYAILHKEFVEDMKKAMSREGDRVIQSVLEGPHDRIFDPDMHEVWKNMRWRGIVKARHLALAIYDHYMQRLDDQNRAITSGTKPIRPIPEEDLWAVQCIDLIHLQSLVEALDSDSSGYVSVQEVNKFTASRPKEWSLVRWLAYWAVGWQVAMSEYKGKIFAILVRIWELRSSINLYEKEVEAYVYAVGRYAKSITATFVEDIDRRYLLERFQDYIDQEQARLRQALETVKYDLDSTDTLNLINGPGGLERHVFVILYLLLKRHHDIMRVAQRVLLHPQEISHATSTVVVVRDAFVYRVAELKALFTQRRLVVDVEIADFACGMLSALQDDISAPPEAALELTVNEDDVELEIDSNEPSDVVLKYPPYAEELYSEQDDLVENEGTEVAEELKPLLGKWAGVRHISPSDAEELECALAYAYVFHISPRDPNKLVAKPKYPWAEQCTRMTAEVEFSGITDDGRREYTISEVFNSTQMEHLWLRVTLSQDGLALEGEEGLMSMSTPAQNRHTVLKKDVCVEIITLYPSPRQLEENKARALWRFAISAILYDVRRRLCTWSLIRERGNIRRLAASLCQRGIELAARGSNLHPDDVKEQARVTRSLVPADVHCIRSCVSKWAQHGWLLPLCGICGRVLRTDKPCLRMFGQVSHPPAEEEFAVCEREECLVGCMRYPASLPPLVFKTWTTGWTMASFLEQSGRTVDDLRELFNHAARSVSLGGERGQTEFDEDSLANEPLTPENSWLSAHHTLSTTAEVGEDRLETDSSVRSQTYKDLGASHLEIPEISDGASSSLLPRRKVSFVLDQSTDPTYPVTEEPIHDGVRPECARCKSEVQLPCWICAQCSDLTYICVSCEDDTIAHGKHRKDHVLMRLWDISRTFWSPPSNTCELEDGVSSSPVVIQIPQGGEGEGEDRLGCQA